MRKFIVGIIIGYLLASSIAYAYKIARPPHLVNFNPESLTPLNEWLEQVWNVLVGRYSVEVTTSIPTTSVTEGEIRGYYSGSTYRIYIYLNGAWRYWNSDG